MSTAAMKGQEDKRRRNARHSETKGMEVDELTIETVSTCMERESVSTHRVRVNKFGDLALVERRGRKVGKGKIILLLT